MKKLVMGFTAFLFLGLVACNKDNDTIANDATTAEDEMTVTSINDDNDAELELQVGFRDPSNNCATITYAQPQGTFPNTITIDYGTQGCVGADGRTRKGIMVVNVTDSIRNAGATRTVTFQNFFIDDVNVQGTRVVTNNGQNAQGQWSFTRAGQQMVLTFPNNKTIAWNGSHTATMTAGAETPLLRLDDEFSVTGGSTGTNRAGKSFSTTIQTPLVRKNTCAWVVSGVSSVMVGNKVLSVNFGTGTCDRLANVTFPNGETREVQIRRWW